MRTLLLRTLKVGTILGLFFFAFGIMRLNANLHPSYSSVGSGRLVSGHVSYPYSDESIHRAQADAMNGLSLWFVVYLAVSGFIWSLREDESGKL